MAGIDIVALKARQIETDTRKLKVTTHLGSVAEGFVERIVEFTKEAIAAGVHGMRLAKARGGQGQIVVDVTINDFPLVIVVGDDILPFELDGPYAGRIFVYVEGNSAPFLDVAVVEEADDRYRCLVHRALDEERVRTIFSATATKEQGERAADTVINFILGFQSVWNKTPPLEGLLNKSATSTIGFKPS